MAHSNRVLCDEAYYWFFRNFNHQLLLNPRSNDFASLRKTLSSGGMRFTEQSLQLQRERIRQALQRNVGEAMSFVRLINQTQGVWRKLHVVFSSMQDDVLRKHWRELVRNAMQPGIVIAALLGFRQGTWQHRLAMRLCKCPQAWHPASSEEGTVSEAFLTRLSDIFEAVEEAFCTEENLRKSRGKDKKGGMDESELQKQLNSEYNRGRNEQEQKGAAERKRLAAELKETKRQLEEASSDSGTPPASRTICANSTTAPTPHGSTMSVSLTNSCARPSSSTPASREPPARRARRRATSSGSFARRLPPSSR